MIKLISKTLWGGGEICFFLNYSDVSWHSLAFSFQLQSHKKYLNIVYWLRLSIKQGRFAALTVRGNYREIFTLKFYATFYHLKEPKRKIAYADVRLLLLTCNASVS